MLILTRKRDQEIVAFTAQGDVVRIVICGVDAWGRVQVGIEAPAHYRILRRELMPGDGDKLSPQ